MSLPFKTLEPLEEVEVAGFTLPKRGSLTVAEEQAFRDFQVVLDTDAEYKDLTGLQADIVIKQYLITTLFRSRLDEEWTLEKTKAPEWEVMVDGSVHKIEPTMTMLDDLYVFFMSEHRRWKTPEQIKAESESAKGESKKK